MSLDVTISKIYFGSFCNPCVMKENRSIFSADTSGQEGTSFHSLFPHQFSGTDSQLKSKHRAAGWVSQ